MIISHFLLYVAHLLIRYDVSNVYFCYTKIIIIFNNGTKNSIVYSNIVKEHLF